MLSARSKGDRTQMCVLQYPSISDGKTHYRYRRGCPTRTRSSKPPRRGESATATPMRRRPLPRSLEEESELDLSGQRQQVRAVAKFPRVINHSSATQRCSTHETTSCLPSSRTTTFHRRRRKSDAEERAETDEASRNSRGTRGEATDGAIPPHFPSRKRF